MTWPGMSMTIAVIPAPPESWAGDLGIRDVQVR